MFKWKVLPNYLFGMILLLGLQGCNRGPEFAIDPRGRLSEYIARSFSIKNVDEKDQLLAFLKGDARTRLESWSNDQFKAAFIESRREFLKLAIREVKEITSSEVQITYELTYIDRKPSKEKSHESKVTNKKLCQMILENGKWYISDVKNLKELVEFQNELSLP